MSVSYAGNCKLCLMVGGCGKVKKVGVVRLRRWVW